MPAVGVSAVSCRVYCRGGDAGEFTELPLKMRPVGIACLLQKGGAVPAGRPFHRCEHGLKTRISAEAFRAAAERCEEEPADDMPGGTREPACELVNADGAAGFGDPLQHQADGRRRSCPHQTWEYTVQKISRLFSRVSKRARFSGMIGEYSPGKEKRSTWSNSPAGGRVLFQQTVPGENRKIPGSRRHRSAAAAGCLDSSKTFGHHLTNQIFVLSFLYFIRVSKSLYPLQV